MKGLAERTIILLVLGIIVLALVGYLVYTNFLKGRGEGGSKFCLAQKIASCSNQITDVDFPKECGSAPDDAACASLGFPRSGSGSTPGFCNGGPPGVGCP